MADPTLQDEKQAILDLMQAGEDNHWQMGAHYNTIVDRGLAIQAGYATAQAFFAHELKQLAQSTLSLYGAVAKSFPESVAKQYGCTKLGHLLSYESEAHLPPASGDPGAIAIHVPQKDGTSAQKAFQDCTVADLTAAVKALKAPAQLPDPQAGKVSRLQAALDTAFGPGKVPVKAHLRGHKVVVELGAFDVDLASTVGDALKA